MKKQLDSHILENLINTLKLRLKELKDERFWDEWSEGVKFGRLDMIEEIIDKLDSKYVNKKVNYETK